MNCKPGDLARIIKDEESCALNIGRIVRVHGPLTVIEGHLCWLIVPLHPDPILVRFGTEIESWHNITLEDGICHIDAWLMPLIFTEQEQLLKQGDKELAEVV